MSNYLDNKIEKPVFIVGPERSGTTLIYGLLSNADEFYWLSRIDSLMPSMTIMSCVLRKALCFLQPEVHAAAYEEISMMKGLITPSECMPYWRTLFGWGDEENYLIDDDRFSEQDVTPEIRKRLHKDFDRRMSFLGKSRLLVKQPGFSLKLSFWDAVFENGLYIICTRSVEDNMRSLVKVRKKSDEQFWGTKVPGWRNYLNADDRTKYLFQLFQIYKIMLESIERRHLVEQVMVVPYEKMILDPEMTSRKVAEFCEVEWNPAMEKSLAHIIKPDLKVQPQSDILAGNIKILHEKKNKIVQLVKSEHNKEWME